jgi:hypothetical protein
VVPSCPVELNKMALGITDLSDDLSLSHPARLSTTADAPPHGQRPGHRHRPRIRTRSSSPPAKATVNKARGAKNAPADQFIYD